MPTLTPTQTATLYLDAFDSVALSCDSSGSGSVAFTSGGRNLRSDATESLKAKTYGPYGAPGTLLITVTGGSVSYSVSRPNGANAVPRILAQSAIPFILASGSGGTGAQIVVGNNGAITSFATQPSGANAGGAWVYFPANTIDGSNQAGWYWMVFSSTTAGTVYNNRYTGGDPIAAIPSSPTAFSSTGPGAFTQSTSLIDGPTGTLPGGALGPNGSLKFALEIGMGATAVDRIWDFYVGSTTMGGTTISSGASTNAGTRQHGVMRNRNSQSRQVASGFASYSNNSSAGVTYFRTENLASDATWKFTLRVNGTVANSYITLDGYDLITQYGA